MRTKNFSTLLLVCVATFAVSCMQGTKTNNRTNADEANEKGSTSQKNPGSFDGERLYIPTPDFNSLSLTEDGNIEDLETDLETSDDTSIVDIDVKCEPKTEAAKSDKEWFFGFQINKIVDGKPVKLDLDIQPVVGAVSESDQTPVGEQIEASGKKCDGFNITIENLALDSTTYQLRGVFFKRYKKDGEVLTVVYYDGRSRNFTLPLKEGVTVDLGKMIQSNIGADSTVSEVPTNGGGSKDNEALTRSTPSKYGDGTDDGANFDKTGYTLRGLTRHNVDCGNRGITSVKLVRPDGTKDKHGKKWSYEYTCSEQPFGSRGDVGYTRGGDFWDDEELLNLYSRELSSLDEQELVLKRDSEKHILGQHYINCGSRPLQQFQLESDGEGFRYRYRCGLHDVGHQTVQIYGEKLDYFDIVYLDRLSLDCRPHGNAVLTAFDIDEGIKDKISYHAATNCRILKDDE